VHKHLSSYAFMSSIYAGISCLQKSGRDGGSKQASVYIYIDYIYGHREILE
jgi:hypothetical protein